MAHHTHCDKSSTPSFEATEGAPAAAIGATTRVKNASASHKAPSHQTHRSQGGNRRRGSKAQSHKTSSSQTSKSSMSDAESNKKRNKLDYTRTSMACAHCRRRKIRCVPDEDDPTSKCGNCLKSNKECVFFPVEQQQQQQRASASGARKESSSVASSPTDMASDDPSYSAYTSIAPLMPGSHAAVLQGYNNATAVSGPTLDTSGAIHHSNQTKSPWQYQSAFQHDYSGLSPHNQYHQQYPPFVQSPSAGDFSPYPIYSPTQANPLYNSPFSPYVKQEAAAVMEHQMLRSTSEQQWSTMPSSSATFSQGYMYPTTTTAAFSQSVFADPTYCSGTLDSTQAPEADAWYSSYGSEEQYDTPPDAKPYVGTPH